MNKQLTYRVRFANTGNKYEGVTIIDPKTGDEATEIPIDGDTDCLFEAEQAGVYFEISFAEPVRKGTISSLLNNGSSSSFTANQGWLTNEYAYLIVVEVKSSAGVQQGSSITGRKPIIRSSGYKITQVLLVAGVVGLVVGLIVEHLLHPMLRLFH
jgi:hypothetical protein